MLLIKNARIINASGELPGLKDILIEDGKITRISQGLACDKCSKPPFPAEQDRLLSALDDLRGVW